jgi:hypothetical protein
LKAAASRRSKATVGSVPLLDALDSITRHIRVLGQVGDSEAKGSADVVHGLAGGQCLADRDPLGVLGQFLRAHPAGGNGWL